MESYDSTRLITLSRPFCRRKKQREQRQGQGQGQSGDREEEKEETLLASMEGKKGKGTTGETLGDRMSVQLIHHHLLCSETPSSLHPLHQPGKKQKAPQPRAPVFTARIVLLGAPCPDWAAYMRARLLNEGLSVNRHFQ
jgi:hypothetical protein